jgi:molybdate transport system regulatory protein
MIRPRLRVLLGSAIAMGPGKADLLEAIERCGSISGAARSLGMSYRRAWQLADTMNRSFRDDLVVAAPGGRRGGGAALTTLGRDVLARYRRMEAKAEKTLATDMRSFRRLMRSEPDR